MTSLEDAKTTATKYLQSLEEAHISVSEMYLFGSYSQNTQHEHSDIDVAVVSPDFGHCRPDERVQLLVARGKSFLDIEPHPIGLNDFRENDWDPFVKEVKKGIRII